MERQRLVDSLEAPTRSKWEQFVNAVKRYWYRFVVISLLISLLSTFWLEWSKDQDLAVERIETAYTKVASSQLGWLNYSSDLISDVSQAQATFPNRESLVPLATSVRETVDAMTAFYIPTITIGAGAQSYRNALLDVLGAVNQYNADEESLKRLLNALQHASNTGGDFQRDIDAYRTDAWRSFWSVMI